MTSWTELNEKNLEMVPESLGVFLLSRGEGNVAYVGRSDHNLRATLQEFLGKSYTHFAWVKVPWTKEGFEMHCRLYHHEGGRKRLDNKEHPIGPNPKMNLCLVSSLPLGMCEV